MAGNTYKNLPPEEQEEKYEYLKARLVDLNQKNFELIVFFVKYILGGCVGGIATLLTYIRALDLNGLSFCLTLSLTFFALGILLIGFMLVFSFFKFMAINRSYGQLFQDFVNSKITIEETFENDSKSIESLILPNQIIVGCAAFCFLCGVIFFLINLLSG